MRVNDLKPELMKEPLYKDKLVEGLHEYVIQDLSALASRPYDTGKFLFSISSFMMVATLSLVTAFKGHYLYCLISILPLFVSYKYSFKLTLAVVQRNKGDTKEKLEKISGNEIEIGNSIYNEYLKKNNWLAQNINCWKICMAIFTIFIVFTVGVATYNTNYEDNKKDNVLIQQLTALNVSVNNVATEITNLRIEIKQAEESDSNEHLNDMLKKIPEQVERNHQSMKREFDINSEHLDRHLRIVKEEINSN